MKPSIFNSIISLNSKTSLLYNAASDKFLIFRNGTLDKSWRPKNLSKSLYSHLEIGGFLIHDNVDEMSTSIHSLHKKVDNDMNFHIIINPTLQCNFRCWYCYEEHGPSKMSPQTIAYIQQLIKNLADQEKNLTISFFGGEPLIFYQEVMYPLIKYAHSTYLESNASFDCNATSNGYLFSEDIINALSNLNFKYVQITLDGDEEHHNTVRHTASNIGSYKKIISNIISLVQHNIDVILRFNYTPENIMGIKSVANEFCALTHNERKRIHVSLHKVWQTDDIDPTYLEYTINAFTEKGIEAKPTLYGEFCYGDKRQSVVINYNGDLYKCTAVDFFNTPRDGYITSGGNLIWENNSLENRISSMFSNKACNGCRIFPLCHGGCSSRPLRFPEGYCILDSDEKKDDVILQKFLYHLRTSSKWQSVISNSHEKI